MDLDVRELVVTLADSGPRYVSADLEFAVWTATTPGAETGTGTRAGSRVDTSADAGPGTAAR